MGKNNIKLRIYPTQEQKDIFEDVFACQKSILLEALAITKEKTEIINETDLHAYLSNISNKKAMNVSKKNTLNNLDNLDNLDDLDDLEKYKNYQYLYKYYVSDINDENIRHELKFLSDAAIKVSFILAIDNKDVKNRIIENLLNSNYFIIPNLNNIAFDFSNNIIKISDDCFKFKTSNLNKIYLTNLITTFKNKQKTIRKFSDISNMLLITVKKSKDDLYYLQIQNIKKNQNDKNIDTKKMVHINENNENLNNLNITNKFNKLNKSIKKIKSVKRIYKNNYAGPKISKAQQNKANKIAELNNKMQNQRNALISSYKTNTKNRFN